MLKLSTELCKIISQIKPDCTLAMVIMKGKIMSGLLAGFIAGTCFAGDDAANFQKYLSQKKTLETVISLYDQSRYSAALPMVRKLIDGANPVAEYYYAASLQYGWGLSQNINRSNEISKRAFPRVHSFAMKGDAVAQYVTGLMYRSGKGVEKDYAKAAAWFRKAGNQGYAQAQLNLGLLYRNGQGVERSAVEAVMWYRKAAERGDIVAQYNLGAMYGEGIGVLKDSAEAFTNQSYVKETWDWLVCYN